MNRFRKSDSKTYNSSPHQQSEPRLSALNLRLLRRCRIVLVKDLDAVEILRQLPEDRLGPDVRTTVTGLADRAQQAGVLLDALETGSDATFSAFMGLLRDQHRQLHSVLEETRHSLETEVGTVDYIISSLYIRLHRLHEMQTIVTDDRAVCPPVCHAAKLGFTVQKWLNGLRSCLG